MPRGRELREDAMRGRVGRARVGVRGEAMGRARSEDGSASPIRTVVRSSSASMNVQTFFVRRARARHLRSGALFVLAAGGAWALLCAALAIAGHSPSVAVVPIPREHYYAAQAVFVVPLLLVSWLLCSTIAERVGRFLGGQGGFVPAANGIAPALALPLIVVFVVPDAIAWALLGFDGLGAVVRVTGPLSFLAMLVLATMAVRAASSLSYGRAFVAAFAGVFVQGALAGVLLR
jgi:hypothetical protein